MLAVSSPLLEVERISPLGGGSFRTSRSHTVM
ncbi:hypothetical protein PUN28_014580 [Cardiocondyla obscurior]|uniref:Uncharacterized protein n=1 Tax=Cardiocondyla obscurior TaxID=286306 RepID=A0AAW2F0V4_9HYME